jgi:hypothetical protein
VYLDRFDHFVTEVLRAPYLRYVDDFALFADDAARLEAWPLGGVSRTSASVAAPGEDARGVDVVASNVPRVRAVAGGGRRRLPEANVRRVPQPPARSA